MSLARFSVRPYPPKLVRVLWAEHLPVSYLQNAKAGCSTVQLTLERDGPVREFGPSDSVSALLARPTFSVVRNPYARALSCYLQKVAPNPKRRNERTRERLVSVGGLDGSREISFSTFLDVAERFPLADRHWAPQWLNLVQPVAPVRVFYLERLAELSAFLTECGLGLNSYADDRVNAASQMDLYDSTSLERVRRLYADDFAMFGYGDDPAVQAPVSAIDALPGDATRWGQHLAALSGSDEAVSE